MPRSYVALDIETTGLDANRDAIIEIAAIRFSDAGSLGHFSSLVNPERAVPAKIVHLTGIDPRQLVRAPLAHEATRRLAKFVGGDVVVGHSIGFDAAFLSHYDVLTGNRLIDTFELSTILLPHMARHSLQHLVEQLQIGSDSSHRALADAEASMRLFLSLQEVARSLAPPVLEQIVSLGRRSGWQQAAFFEDMLREQLQRPLGTSIGQQLFAKGLLDQRGPLAAAARRPEAVPDIEPRRPPSLLDPDAIRGGLEPGGQLASAMPGYELRQEQLAMLEAVTRAINLGKHLAVEAGTGVGKSLAYLLPALQFAALNDERFVISTHTINLQEQLFSKDIPQVAQALNLPVRLALLKGRSNYLCLARLHAVSNRERMSPEQALALAKIVSWLPGTATGDRTELFLNTPAERHLWGQVCSDQAWCGGERCPQRWRGNCFFQQARATASKAHVVVVNHALLTTDAIMDSRVLPEYEHLIVDEAHQLESACTRTLHLELTVAGLRELTRDIVTFESGTIGGPLAQIQSLSRKPKAPAGLSTQVAALVEDMGSVQPLLDNLASALDACAGGLLPSRGSERSGYEQRRITDRERTQAEWRNLTEAWKPGSRLLRRAVGTVAEVSRILAPGGEDDPLAEPTQALAAAGRDLEEQIDAMDEVIASPSPENVYWLATQDQAGTPVLNRVPLSVAETLGQTLFGKKRCVILTSATLATDESFDYFAEQVGLEGHEALRVGSPFDYRRSTLVCVATDVPEPRHPGHQRAVEQAIFDLARATGGRLMALFTSTSQLRATSRALARPLEQEGILVYSQTDGSSRNQLLQGFRSAERAVLLGTRSFWEGVDVPGDALSCLVMVKLPFMVPDDPLVAARGERFRDSFNEYLLPEAILTFRQGFGRLIRSKSDRGVFVLLDSRVRSKAYGAHFIKALPDCTFVSDPASGLPERARAWLDAGQAGSDPGVRGSDPEIRGSDAERRGSGRGAWRFRRFVRHRRCAISHPSLARDSIPLFNGGIALIPVTDLRRGVIFELDGELYRVLEYTHSKPARGNAYIRTKARNLRSGATLEKTFVSGDRVQDVRLDHRIVQYLYPDQDLYYFMDKETFEQIPLDKKILGDATNFLAEGMELQLSSHLGEPLDIELPTTVDLEVTHTEPGFRGDTANAATKPATVTTGFVVQVPLFVNVGDVIRIDTRDGSYLTRAK